MSAIFPDPPHEKKLSEILHRLGSLLKAEEDRLGSIKFQENPLLVLNEPLIVSFMLLPSGEYNLLRVMKQSCPSSSS